MAESSAPSVTASVQINASSEAVYRLITDLATLTELAEETVAMRWRKGDSARPGAVFSGDNSNGPKRWSTTCTVTDADPGRRFAFDVRAGIFPVSRWCYDIAADSGGCRVTESTWDRRPGWLLGISRMISGVGDRGAANAEHIRLTLDRLKQRAEAG